MLVLKATAFFLLAAIFSSAWGSDGGESERCCSGSVLGHDLHKCHIGGVRCAALGTSVPTADLYDNYRLHYNLMGSKYYFGRMAYALGISDQCPLQAKRSVLRSMDLITPWSGTHGAIAIDGANGFEQNILRKCDFPVDPYPFICRGGAGTPGTYGKLLGTLSYISLLHDEVAHRWTLFGHCWNPQTPEDPDAEPIGTSFNVFSLDPVLPPRVRTVILNKLQELGFDTSPDNLIEPNYST